MTEVIRFISEHRSIIPVPGRKISGKTGEIRQASSDSFFLQAMI